MSATQTKSEVVSQSTSFHEGTGLRIARSIGTWLFGVGYAVWLGGLIALGALMAPNVAATLHDPVVVAGGEPLRRVILNGIVGNSFRVLNWVCVGCYVAMTLGLELEWRKKDELYRKWTKPLFYLLLFAGVIMVLSIDMLSAMDAAQTRGDMQRFDSLHHAYETRAMVQFALLLVMGGVKALRDWFARNDRN